MNEQNQHADADTEADTGSQHSHSALAISRRQLLAGAAGVAGVAALGGGGHFIARAASGSTSRLPRPSDSGVEHIVVVMMENRSFDHLVGWLPGADGQQAGLSYVDKSGTRYLTHQLAPEYQGCGFIDPDHSYEGGRVEFNRGRNDGWLRANDVFSIGYYNQEDLSFYGAAAPQWMMFDRYFAGIMAETYPNRFIQHAAQTDRIHNSMVTSTLPTIWDRLADAHLTGRYYFGDIPFLALWGTKYLPISSPFPRFIADCAAGTLPQVSFVDPRFLDEGSGTSGDDHPHADIRNGQAFLNQIYTAVTTGPKWSNTVLVINYDEWGGFFDHVVPPTAPLPAIEHAAGNRDGLRGFRVPAMVVSPWARRGAVSHTVYDHASVLRMIEWRWGLKPLTVRDARANNLAEALDFSRKDLTAPKYLVPPGPFGTPCPVGSSIHDEEWKPLAALARKQGWTTY
ncbi:MAG: phospholipase C [Chloroflexota bacterium]